MTKSYGDREHDHQGEAPEPEIIGGTIPVLTEENLAEQLRRAREFSDANYEDPFYHITLSAPDADDLDEAEWNEFAEEYLDRLGYSETQHSIIRHQHQDHDHIHIIGERTDAETGTAVDRGFERVRSMEILEDLEQEFGLTQTNHEQNFDQKNTPKHVEVLKSKIRKMEPDKREDALLAFFEKEAEDDWIETQGDLEALAEEAGFEINRSGSDYVSIKDPNSNFYDGIHGGKWRIESDELNSIEWSNEQSELEDELEKYKSETRAGDPEQLEETLDEHQELKDSISKQKEEKRERERDRSDSHDDDRGYEMTR